MHTPSLPPAFVRVLFWMTTFEVTMLWPLPLSDPM